MPFSIALAGKGGTGKTTLAGMLIKYLGMKEKTPVLAVDADCNSNLNEVLGVEVTDTLGNAREEMKKGIVPGGITKDIFMSMKIEQAVVETKNFDLLVMGQPEGQGCYCAANTLLTGFLERLTGNYPYMVMDNEAGMEHISRLTTSNVDVLLVVADTSRRGPKCWRKPKRKPCKGHIGVGKSFIVINQCKEKPSKFVLDLIDKSGMELIGTIPEDDTIYEFDLKGLPTIEIPDDNKAFAAAVNIFDKIVK